MSDLMSAGVVALVVCLCSVCLTWRVRKYALRTRLLDQPNARSSHTQPTARGGGLAIVLASMLGALALWGLGLLHLRFLFGFIAGGGLLAAVGFLDDRRGVSPLTRVCVHIAAAVVGVASIGGLPVLQFGMTELQAGLVGSALGVIALVWTINLFNFMDGIDGIAGSEAVFVSAATATLILISGGGLGLASLSAVIAAAALGFLFWNWPPAKIFMGDVGSGYLGYTLGLLALSAARVGDVQLASSMILGGVFMVDATLTLLRRFARGERVYEAHRTHAYQWLARRWASHRRVTLLVVGTNLLWLAPCAAWAALRPEHSLWALAVALPPLAIVCFVSGSGRPERPA